MIIHLACACGAELQVQEAYSGGQVFCHACGSPVRVPSMAASEDKFRFHCPHCEARVLARRASAGKKSRCPSCGKVYVVPDPPAEPDSDSSTNDHRIRLETDELALRFGLPFPVGKLETPRQTEPRPRYLHPADEKPPSPEPPSYVPFSGLGRRIDHPEAYRPPADAVPTAQFSIPNGHFQPACATRDESTDRAEDRPLGGVDVQAGETWAVPSGENRAAGSNALESDPEPSPNVGELRIVGGTWSGRRITMDFRQFLVGTERDCQLRMANPLFSRHHCVFKKDEYALRVRDLGSSNGTFVNGRRIMNEVILNPGDEVTVGDMRVSVVLPHAPQVTQLKTESNPSISDFVIL